jgi:hypothetical protein
MSSQRGGGTANPTPFSFNNSTGGTPTMKKKDPKELAMAQHAYMEKLIRERDVWVRLAPVLMKWEGKKINCRIKDQAQEVLKEYHVWYSAPEKFLGRGKLSISEDWKVNESPRMNMKVDLGPKEDVNCFHYGICISTHNRWFDENILTTIEQIRRGIPLIAALCHKWNRLCDDYEAVYTEADQLHASGFSVRD